MAKTKHTVCFDNKVWEKAQQHYEEYNFKSVSELIDTALDFYLGYRTSGEIENYLAEGLMQSLRSIVKSSEDRLARILFKIAVGDAEMKHLFAAALGLSSKEVDKIRKHCLDEIKTMNGVLDLKEAARWQAGEDN